MIEEIDSDDKIVIVDSGVSGCVNESIAIFRPIRRGGSIKDIQRWRIYFRFLFAKALGIYGRRWISETVLFSDKKEVWG